MKKHSLIRTIYLYLFALVGLVLLVIAGVRFINMGLKAYVFTQADEQERLWNKQPPMRFEVERLEKITTEEPKEDEGRALTENEREQVKRLLVDYEEWQKRSDEFDPITSNRQRDASINLSMIIIGLPLYAYHWRIIKKETKEK